MSWERLEALGRRTQQGNWEWPAEQLGDVIGELAELGWRVDWMEGRLYAPDGTYAPIGEGTPSDTQGE